jgi:hypothetical protein
VNPLLSQKQFAGLIGKTLRHTQRLFAEGLGPPVVRTGIRSFGITPEDAAAWISARRVVPPGWQDKTPSDGIAAGATDPEPTTRRATPRAARTPLPAHP